MIDVFEAILNVFVIGFITSLVSIGLMFIEDRYGTMKALLLLIVSIIMIVVFILSQL